MSLPTLTEREVELYEAHFALLLEWNQKISLVSRKSVQDSFAPHYADSVWISEFAHKHLEGNETVRDLGTGAGFPGVLFAIRYPEARVILYEKMAKKKPFLEEVIAKLGLSNVTLEGELPNKQLTGLFLGRAVFPLHELLPFMSSRMAERSKLILNVGGEGQTPELPKEFKELETFKYTLPLDFGSRKCISIQKVPRGTLS